MGAPDNAAINAHLGAARPRTLAALTRYFCDLDLAEDALQEASVNALTAWARNGVPRDPVAWLIVAGRNRGLDQIRRNSKFLGGAPEAVLDAAAAEIDVEQMQAAAIDAADYKDDVLRLMFMCCAPELAVTDQLALALKVIAGMSTAEIAKAFLTTPKAMEQRITRAKKRAAAVATRLEPPSMTERAARVEAVSTMIYLMFNEGYQARAGDAAIRIGLCEEAIRLARLLLSLFPGQSEAMGLLALLLLQHARHRARLDEAGALVALADQDRTLWNREMIDEAMVHGHKAMRRGRPGPLVVQAAIAAAHCAAPSAEATDWAEIERLYAVLYQLQPSPVVRLNGAVATAKLRGPAAALAVLEPLEEELARYLPYRTTLAALRADTGQTEAAAEAWRQALELGPNPAERAHIEARIRALTQNFMA